MRDGLVAFLGLVMVAYVLFLGVAIAFLPLAGGFFYGHIGAIYVALIFIASAAVAFSFFEKRGVAGLLALIQLLIVLFYYGWLNRYRGPGAWSVFFWNALPSLVFAACGVANWVLARATPNQPDTGEGDH
jgi:hypothetical protein